MTPPTQNQPLFDAYAAHYDAALNQGIAVSGESKEFFAEQRVRWLAKHLLRHRPAWENVLDFGCGVGTSFPFLWREFRPVHLAGFDVSTEALAVARRVEPGIPIDLSDTMEAWPESTFDLVSTNGVFHHIEPEARQAALRAIWRVLKPGGCLAVWENNPWNPGARYVMYRIPFDRDAVLVYPSTARAMLAEGGFATEAPQFTFVFPRVLSLLRVLEPALSRWPFGAQYLQIGWKP